MCCGIGRTTSLCDGLGVLCGQVALGRVALPFILIGGLVCLSLWFFSFGRLESLWRRHCRDTVDMHTECLSTSYCPILMFAARRS